MLDPKLIRNDPDRVRSGIAAKRMDPTRVDEWLALDQKRRDIVGQVEMLKAERNTSSTQIGVIMKSGGDAGDMKDAVRRLGGDIKGMDDALRELDEQIQALAQWFPNLPHETTPVGDESANRVVRTWGEPVHHDFPALSHDELGAKLGILELERGARMSGSGFAVLRGAGAALNRALIQFMIDLHVREHGYTELAVPYLVKRESLFGTGQLPKLAEDMYRTDPDDLFLIPTAEVSITNFHREEMLAQADLPMYYVGHSACFRRESGSHGKDTRGMTRVHQFDKVEMVRFVEPSRSYEELELLLGNAETVLKKLGLAYRVQLLASGDISFAASKCYDIDVWAPGADRWLEVSSCSNFEGFQARRADIRFRPADDGRPEHLHTLNGSGLALPRTIIALLETYQTAQGTVRIPEVLQPYLGGLTELS